MRIAIIPARGGSKRIKNKNIVPLAGQPMIHYSLAAAKESRLFDKIHVSTDSEEIRNVVENLGFPVDFLRTKELADDFTPIMPVLKWTLEQFLKLGKPFDEVCLLMPTAPLLLADDLIGGHKTLLAHDRKKPALAVSVFPAPIEWAFNMDRDGSLVANQPEMLSKRSQDLTPKYFDTGMFCFFSGEQILKGRPPEEQTFVGHLLGRDRVVDIDTLDDLALAEALYLGRRERGKQAP